MRISEHFKREEFECRCGCGQSTVDVELITILERVRDHFGKPITITSGNRCKAYNKEIGGAENSQHLTGKAADFKVKDVLSREVYDFINLHAPSSYGLGLYSSWTHFDSRSEFARWGK